MSYAPKQTKPGRVQEEQKQVNIPDKTIVTDKMKTSEELGINASRSISSQAKPPDGPYTTFYLDIDKKTFRMDRCNENKPGKVKYYLEVTHEQKISEHDIPEPLPISLINLYTKNLEPGKKDYVSEQLQVMNMVMTGGEFDKDTEDILTVKKAYDEKEILTLKNKSAGNITESHRKYLLGPAIDLYRLARSSWSAKDFKDPEMLELYNLVSKSLKASTDPITDADILKVQDKKSWAIYGALFNIAQTADEAGWGNLESLNKNITRNNYWGHKAGGKPKSYSSLGEGYFYHLTRLKQRFPDAIKYYESGKFTYDKMDDALESGKYRTSDESYHYNYHEANYSEKFIKMVRESILPRWRTVLQEEIDAIHNQKTPSTKLNERAIILQWILHEINTIG
jgi:hypothetical protein